MKIIRTLANITLFPVRLIILLAQLALGAIINLSAWLIHLVAGVLLFAGIIGKFTGLDNPTFIFILIFSIAIYLVPVLGELIISALTAINVKLKF